MTEASSRVLAEFDELVKVENGGKDSRRRFIRMKEAVEAYGMSRTKLRREALIAGALYRVGDTLLINVDIFEKYLETFRIPGEMW